MLLFLRPEFSVCSKVTDGDTRRNGVFRGLHTNIGATPGLKFTNSTPSSSSWIVQRWLGEFTRSGLVRKSTIDTLRARSCDLSPRTCGSGWHQCTLLRPKNGNLNLLEAFAVVNVIGTDPGIVGGSHGRLPENPDKGPLFISSSGDDAANGIRALQIRERILKLL